MRSCEYSRVNGPRKTKLITLRDMAFYCNRAMISLSQITNNTDISSVSITFRHQKNGEKEATITMHSTTSPFCPVKTLRSLCLRILSYPKSSLDSPINLVHHNNNEIHVTSKMVMQHIRGTVTLIGPEELGFHAKEVGTHSIRSSFAMFLYINGIRSDKIMLQGRWKSQGFLTYIRRLERP